MIVLTLQEVLLLHRKLLAATGGLPGVRDRGLLESAVYGVSQTFGGEALYPSVEEKAARLAYAIVSNHPFQDGNKRTGILAMLTMLRLNGVRLAYTQAELIALGYAIAQGERDYGQVLAWIRKHKVLPCPVH